MESLTKILASPEDPPSSASSTSLCLSPEVQVRSDTAASSLKGRVLTVSTVPFEEWHEMIYVVRNWASNVFFKCRSDPSSELLDASQGIIKSIKRQLKLSLIRSEDPCRGWDTIFVCQDRDETIQAIALVKLKTHYIDYLATHPDNLNHPMNTLIKDRVRGAATEIILHLAERTLATGKLLNLIALKSAMPFYKSLSFKRARGISARAYDTYDLTVMQLHASSIRKLALKDGSPFTRFKTE